MINHVSKSGFRGRIVAVAVTAALIVGWFLPASSKCAIIPIATSPSGLFSPNANSVQVFHCGDELSGNPIAGALPQFNWDTHNLVRVRHGAPGYQVVSAEQSDRPVQFGSIAHSARCGGWRWFCFLNEPLPGWFSNNVHQVSSELLQEAWFAVPKDVQIEWIEQSRLQLIDAGFGLGAALLATAFLPFAITFFRRKSDVPQP